MRSRHVRSAPLTLATSVLIFAASLVAGIAIARALGPSGKGDLARLVVFAALAFDVASFGVDQTITVFVAQIPDKRRELMRALDFPVRLQALAGVGIYLLLTVIAGTFEPRLLVPLVAYGLLVATQIHMVRNRSYLLGRGDFMRLNATRVLSEALPAAFILLLAVFAQLTLASAAVSYLAGVGIAFWFAASAVRPDMETAVAPVQKYFSGMKSFWSFSRRNFASIIAARGNSQVDLLLLSLLAISTARVGEYSVASTAGISIAIIGGSFGMVVLSRVGKVHRGVSPWPVLFPILLAALGLAALAAVALWFLAPTLIPLIYGEAFSASIRPAQILAIGGFSVSTTHVLGAALRGVDRPGSVTVAEGVGVLVTILCIAIFGIRDLELVAVSAVAGFAATLALEAAFLVAVLRSLGHGN